MIDRLFDQLILENLGGKLWASKGKWSQVEADRRTDWEP
jgi:hypothetical protein